jgi:hypothetical protein
VAFAVKATAYPEGGCNAAGTASDARKTFTPATSRRAVATKVVVLYPIIDLSWLMVCISWWNRDVGGANQDRKYFYRLKRIKPNSPAHDSVLQDRLLVICAEISGVTLPT